MWPRQLGRETCSGQILLPLETLAWNPHAQRAAWFAHLEAILFQNPSNSWFGLVRKLGGGFPVAFKNQGCCLAAKQPDTITRPIHAPAACTLLAKGQKSTILPRFLLSYVVRRHQRYIRTMGAYAAISVDKNPRNPPGALARR